MIPIHDNLESVTNLLEFYLLEQGSPGLTKIKFSSGKLPKNAKSLRFNIPEDGEQYSLHYKTLTLSFRSKSRRDSFMSDLERELELSGPNTSLTEIDDFENFRLYSHIGLGYHVRDYHQGTDHNYVLSLQMIIPVYTSAAGYKLSNDHFKRIDRFSRGNFLRDIEKEYKEAVSGFLKSYKAQNKENLAGTILVLPSEFGVGRLCFGYMIDSNNVTRPMTIGLRTGMMESLFSQIKETGMYKGKKISAIHYTNGNQLSVMSKLGAMIKQNQNYSIWDTGKYDVLTF